MPAFSVDGEISLDSTKVSQATRKAKTDIKSMSTKATGHFKAMAKSWAASIGAMMGVSAVVVGLKGIISEAGKIRDKATSIGITTDAFQELDFAARQTDTSIEAIGKSIQRLARNIGTVLSGRGPEQLEAINRLGISLEDLQRMSPDIRAMRVFEAFSEHVEKAGVNSQTLNDAILLLGRSGADVLPAMAAGMGELRKQARDAGLVIDSIDIQKLAAAGDQLTTAGAKLKVALAPVATLLADIVSKISILFTITSRLAGRFGETKGLPTAARVAATLKGAPDLIREAFLEAIIQEARFAKRPRGAGAAAAAADVAIEDVQKAQEDKKPREPDKPSQRVVKTEIARDTLTRAALPPVLSSSDRLARIGGFASGAGNLSRQVARLDEIANTLKQSQDELRAIKTNTGQEVAVR